MSDASFSPDSRFLATCSLDGTARIWDASTGLPLSPPLRHGARVKRVWFGRAGKHLYTAGSDNVLKRWNVAPDERPRDELILVAQLLAGHTLDASGSLIPLEDHAVCHVLEQLHDGQNAKHIDRQLVRWHENEAEAYDLYAAANAADTENDLLHIRLPGTLPAGNHVIAISLHNQSSWSSDLRIGEISLSAKPLESER